MGLLVGLNDTVSLIRYEKHVDYHFVSDLSVNPSNETVSCISPDISSGSTGSEKKLQKYREYYHLSARETDVLEQVLKDRPINEMAKALFISPRTVKFHVASLLKKTAAAASAH